MYSYVWFVCLFFSSFYHSTLPYPVFFSLPTQGSARGSPHKSLVLLEASVEHLLAVLTLTEAGYKNKWNELTPWHGHAAVSLMSGELCERYGRHIFIYIVIIRMVCDCCRDVLQSEIKSVIYFYCYKSSKGRVMLKHCFSARIMDTFSRVDHSYNDWVFYLERLLIFFFYYWNKHFCFKFICIKNFWHWKDFF